MTDSKPPLFFYIRDDLAIGTPDGIAESERTIDTTIRDLSTDLQLQTELGLISASLDRMRRSPEQLEELTAFMLASFHTDPVGQAERLDYLLNQGAIRIVRMGSPD